MYYKNKLLVLKDFNEEEMWATLQFRTKNILHSDIVSVIELDADDIEYLKSKYLLKEIGMKELELEDTRKKLNSLFEEISELKK